MDSTLAGSKAASAATTASMAWKNISKERPSTSAIKGESPREAVDLWELKAGGHMGTHFGWGIFLVLLGGLLNGSFYVPMKRMPLWRWENTWLIYSIFAMIVIPWGLAWAAVPHLTSVYHETPWPTLGLIAIFGLGWGIGSTLFGLGVAKVGMALALRHYLGHHRFRGRDHSRPGRRSWPVMDVSGTCLAGRYCAGHSGHHFLRPGGSSTR